MQLKINLILAIIFFLSLNSFSQENHNMIAKISPIKVLLGDFRTESYCIGFSLEKKVKTKFSVEQFLGYITKTNRNFKGMWGFNVEKLSGFRSDTEFKYYFEKSRNSPDGLNLGLRLMVLYTKAQDYLTVNNVYGVLGDIHRTMIGSYIHLGWQADFNRIVTFSPSIYVGGRFIVSNNSLGGYHSANDYGGKDYASGSSFSLGFGLDISIGFILK